VNAASAGNMNSRCVVSPNLIVRILKGFPANVRFC
jgi:hypothetical protein